MLTNNLFAQTNDYIYLYHLVNSKEIYESILKNGLYSSAGLGRPIPGHPQSAEKCYDIFFHPLRINETTKNLPVGTRVDMGVETAYLIIVAVNMNTEIQVNNRLHSLGVKPLYIIGLSDYFKSEKYDQEGLPEVRIKINHVPASQIAGYGKMCGDNVNITMKEKNAITPLELGHDHLRFPPSAPRFHL